MVANSPASTGVVYSTAASAGIADLVAERYGFEEPVQCELLNRGFNDAFLVRTSKDERYVFRLSSLGRRVESDVAAETAFLAYLQGQGIPVAAPRPMPDGSLFTGVQLPEGNRPAVLFRYLAGRRPDHFDVNDARLQGRTLARIHNAASSFDGLQAGSHRADLDHLLLEPLKKVLSRQALETDARKYLTALSERLTRSVTGDGNLSWTRCHGDCHGANARIVAAEDGTEEAAFFDFDDGGFGYLSYDLAVHLWAHTSFGRSLHRVWHAFVEGYREVRPIGGSDFEAVHRFVMIRHFWLMGEYASRAAEWGTENFPAKWLNAQADFLRRWEEDRLSPPLLGSLG